MANTKPKKRNPQDSTLRNIRALKKELADLSYEFRAFKRQAYIQKVVLPRSKWEMPVKKK